MLLSHRHKFIFVHVQKTGGTSVMEALRPYCDERALEEVRASGLSSHAAAAQIITVFGRKLWDEYFTFAFERNPWDKCLSLYYYQLQHWDKYRKPLRPRQPTFHQWLHPFPFGRKKLRPSLPQYSIDGQVAVKFLGRYESLHDDFREIAARIGLAGVELPYRNRSLLRIDAPDYRQHYTDRMRRRVARAYQREISLLGYEF